ncbi:MULTISPECIES: DUF397 domain-containing protein [unclassified Streptomyces]|nr:MULTISPECIES: DUF397 domain-containing protein [unclassified Streptomyces]WSP57510.1 DUF397 domain-containing protein [Streptomyces sp. NBC_01241]WSU21753.1 DUF397 domain-containing protein [Streptomyces sp. NBC_01108]MCX4789366.1 DUF397 domain-containing protein [Streptomyces sp. NBC_01221]MCX4794908.1 DUF397 domain-containing protein [Streptomyces sp. NBC_01242]WSJ36212.1 DUF397 domain-containing protein [Streptomyces sp. NBC_01321]
MIRAAWRTSSYSGGQGDCVEIATNLPHLVPVRDSKRAAGPVIGFGRGAWQAFVRDLG